MTVAELIGALMDFDPDADVMIEINGGLAAIRKVEWDSSRGIVKASNDSHR